MKFKLVSLLLTLVAIKAQAYPNLNDRVVYEGQVVLKNTNRSITFLQTLEIIALDTVKKEYTLLNILDLPNGDVKEEKISVPSQEMLTVDQIKSLLNTCEQQGGKKEKILVAAGEFDTCKITSQDGNISYLGDVPFGLVKSISKEADSDALIIMELSLIEKY